MESMFGAIAGIHHQGGVALVINQSLNHIVIIKHSLKYSIYNELVKPCKWYPLI